MVFQQLFESCLFGGGEFSVDIAEEVLLVLLWVDGICSAVEAAFIFEVHTWIGLEAGAIEQFEFLSGLRVLLQEQVECGVFLRREFAIYVAVEVLFVV